LSSLFNQQIKFYWHSLEKRLIKLKTKNVPKQFKTNHNILKILKILSCIENANINKWKFHGYTFIYFRVTLKTKIDFLELYDFYVVFPGAFENYRDLSNALNRFTFPSNKIRRKSKKFYCPKAWWQTRK